MFGLGYLFHKNFDILYKDAKIVNKNGFSSVLKELHLAFSEAFKFFLCSLPPLLIIGFWSAIFKTDIMQYTFWALFALVALYAAMIFGSYSSGIFVSSKFNIMNIPAKNLENSIVDWITIKPIRDSIKRREIKVTDINYAHFSTFTTKHIKNSNGTYWLTIHHYALNVTGTFGSIMLDFRSPQKRDEIVGLLTQAADDLKHKISIRHI